MTALLFLLPLAFAEDLAVSSNIKGLSIVVNGSDTGLKTPAVVTGLSPGMVSVQVGDNCRAGEAMVEVTSGANKVSIHAEDALATLTVQVTPSQAVVDVNHGKVKLSPNVPVGLPCGTYDISASLKGYETAGYTLELIGGQELTLPMELSKLGVSTVELSVEPRTATLLFDGKEVGHDAASLPNVFAGMHTLGASSKGYNTLAVPIIVGDGDDLVFKVELGRGDDKGSVSAVGGAGKVALSKAAPAKKAAKAPEKEPEEESDEPDAVADDDPAGADEPDEELAPAKSWSELHAEEAKKEAPKPATKKEASLDLDTPEKPKNPKAGLKAGGGVLLGLGAVVGVGGGIYTYTEANAAYAAWQGLQATADGESGGAQKHDQQVADDYWTNEFAPRGNAMYGTFVAGGVLAATGIVLLVIDGEGPVVAPMPGGGWVGWSGSF